MKKLLAFAFTAVICMIACFILKTDSSAAPCSNSIEITPALYNFGPQPMLSSSAPQPFVITNTSSCPGDLTGLFVGKTGSHSKHFKIVSNDCGTTLAPGATCTVAVAFSPKAIGVFSDAGLWVAAATPAIDDTAELSGEGTEAEPGTVLMLTQLGSKGDSDGCNASASTGVAGRTSSGPAALGLIALMGLVLGAVTIRRRMRKRS